MYIRNSLYVRSYFEYYITKNFTLRGSHEDFIFGVIKLLR